MGFWDRLLDPASFLQNVLASAAFLLLTLGLKVAVTKLVGVASLLSKKRRRGFLINEKLRCMVALSDDPAEQSMIFTLLLFGAANSAGKAALSLLLAALLGELSSVLYVVGVVVAIYYVLEAMADVKDIHTTDLEAIRKHLEKVRAELETLKEYA